MPAPAPTASFRLPHLPHPRSPFRCYRALSLLPPYCRSRDRSSKRFRTFSSTPPRLPGWPKRSPRCSERRQRRSGRPPPRKFFAHLPPPPWPLSVSRSFAEPRLQIAAPAQPTGALRTLSPCRPLELQLSIHARSPIWIAQHPLPPGQSWDRRSAERAFCASPPLCRVRPSHFLREPAPAPAIIRSPGCPERIRTRSCKSQWPCPTRACCRDRGPPPIGGPAARGSPINQTRASLPLPLFRRTLILTTPRKDMHVPTRVGDPPAPLFAADRAPPDCRIPAASRCLPHKVSQLPDSTAATPSPPQLRRPTPHPPPISPARPVLRAVPGRRAVPQFPFPIPPPAFLLPPYSANAGPAESVLFPGERTRPTLRHLSPDSV